MELMMSQLFVIIMPIGCKNNYYDLCIVDCVYKPVFSGNTSTP